MSDQAILYPSPLKIEGVFNPNDLAAIDASWQVIGEALSPFTGQPREVTFPAVFSNLTIWANPWLKDYFGHTTAGGTRIALMPGMVSVPLVIHELGHAFNDRQPARLRPYKLLQREWIRTPDGKGILGLPSPLNGFPTDRYGPDRQHPQSWDKIFSFLEDFCDMWLLWVLCRLPRTEPGKARKVWMDGLMSRLLQKDVSQ